MYARQGWERIDLGWFGRTRGSLYRGGIYTVSFNTVANLKGPSSPASRLPGTSIDICNYTDTLIPYIVYHGKGFALARAIRHSKPFVRITFT